MSKVVICGSRNCPEDSKNLLYELDEILFEEYRSGCKADQIVSGMARGADTLAVNFAKTRGVPLIEMPADWDKHGKAAGYIRNIEMLELPFVEHVIALWDGKSKGTKHTIDNAFKRKIKTTIIFLEE